MYIKYHLMVKKKWNIEINVSKFLIDIPLPYTNQIYNTIRFCRLLYRNKL